MDYKICNIELVNRLLAWQHTAFKTKTSISVVLPGRERESTPKTDKPPPARWEPPDLLNVIAQDAADFVFHHKLCCSFYCLPPHCRSPPPRLDFQNSDEMEELLCGTEIMGKERTISCKINSPVI